MVLAALSPHPTPHNPVIPGNPRETGRPWVATSCMRCLFPVGGCQSLGIGLRVAADALTGEACEAQVAGSAKALSKPGLVALRGGFRSGVAAFLHCSSLSPGLLRGAQHQWGWQWMGCLQDWGDGGTLGASGTVVWLVARGPGGLVHLGSLYHALLGVKDIALERQAERHRLHGLWPLGALLWLGGLPAACSVPLLECRCQDLLGLGAEATCKG